MSSNDLAVTSHIEFFVPEREEPEADTRMCLCCEKLRPSSCMDDDGCGICEECLSP